jgi:hypothetical protein
MDSLPHKERFLSNNNKKVLCALKQKIVEEDLIISKADKGNSVVILNKTDYFRKCYDVLDDSTFATISKDPTARFQKSVKSALASCSLLFKHSEKINLIQMNPLPPRFYGLPKIHKDGSPIRPVVSCIGSPSYKLASKLNSILRLLTGFSAKYGVANSINLTRNLRHLSLPPNSKLVSFDVKNLFTSVPIHKTLLLTKELLTTSDVDPQLAKEFSLLLELCVNQNYFLFNNNFYKQTDGLAMGSPLSPILADIFMDNLESQLFNSNLPILQNILYWYRYVDDIICCWTGSDRQLDCFLNLLNAQHQKISFTMEIESNKSLNFLDLNISIKNNRHHFAVFRKPCSTDNIIPADSCHSTSQKLSAFHSLLYRLVYLPLSTEEFNQELNIIKSMAITNGYNVNIVDKLLNNKLKKLAISKLCPLSPSENKIKKWNRLRYVGKLSNKLARRFPKDKFNVALYNPVTLGSLLCKNKDRIDPHLQSGIYRVNCGDCDKCYIGQTGRNFRTRLNEHRRCWLNNDESSLLAKHLLMSSHSCDFIPEILHIEKKGMKLDILEQLEILKIDEKTLLNEQLFVNHSPLLDVNL